MKDNNKFPIALTKCFFCGEINHILLGRRLNAHVKEIEDMNGKVIDMTPCSKCEEYMRQGVIIITFDPTKSDPNWHKDKMPNPYRTGGFFVIREEAVHNITDDKRIIDFMLNQRWIFIEHEAAEKIGLFAMAENENSN